MTELPLGKLLLFRKSLRSRGLAALLCLGVLWLPLRARADWLQAGPTDSLALGLPADAAVTLGGLAFWAATEAAKGKLAPASCRFCNGPDNSGLSGDPLAGQGSLNGVDAWFHDQLTGSLLSRKGADTASNWLGFGLLPAAALSAAWLSTGPHASDGAGLRSSLIAAQGLAVAGAVIQSVKLLAARKRPFVRYGHGTDGATADEGGTYDVHDPDSHLSFPSGHTGATAALGFGAAMVATLSDSKAAPWLWAGAGLATASVASLRMIAEKHYFTDVLAGAAIGAASGILVPLLHQRDHRAAAGARLGLSAGAGGLPLLAVSGVF
jgi:membrane-associated phospholipid phosphatase